MPPYYNLTFINTILSAKSEGKDIVGMTTRQWYFYLLEKDVLKTTGEDGSTENVLSKIERKHPEYDWNEVWVKMRLPFLPSNVVSFIWKLIHNILTTEERLNSTLGNISERCRYGCEDLRAANQIHCFFNCTLTYSLGQWLLQVVRRYGPLTESDILKLNVPNNHALIWVIASTLYYCWNKRVMKKSADPLSFLAQLDSELKVMEETGQHQLAQEIRGILRQDTF